jgi:lipopolysaccharide export system permease protein
MFGTILQRMIFWDLVRVFLLALVTLTGLFLLGGLVAEATQRGLAPSQVLMVIPLLVPNTLPYTIPATTLFATCVVYGRLAHDNEVTAVKAAGVHLGRLIAPSALLGVLTASGTMALYLQFIPETHHVLRTQVLGDVEELLYGLLKRQGCLRARGVSYSMWVRQVQGKRLIDAIFKERSKDKDGYKFVARAREARIHFVPERNVVRLDMSNMSSYGENDLFSMNSTDPSFEVPLPGGLISNDYQRRPSDLGYEELFQRRVEIRDEVREAVQNAEHPPIDPNLPPAKVAQMTEAFHNIAMYKQRDSYAIDAELHLRPALAIGCLCFALIGGPVGIWFSRADYLSAFVSCFLPTVFVYYPLLLCGTNLAKEGRLPPAVGLWAANAAVGAAGAVLYWRLLRR